MRRPATTSPSSSRTRKTAEMPFNDYDKIRAENLMRNNARIQALGIKSLVSIRNDSQHCNNKLKKAKNNTSNGEDAESDYDPEEDEGSKTNENDDNFLEDEEELMEDRYTSTRSRVKAPKPSNMPPGARPQKRVRPPTEMSQVPRVTRLKSKQLPSGHDEEDRSQGRDELCTPSLNSNLVGSCQPRSDNGVTPSTTNDVDQSMDVLGQFEQHIPLDDEGRAQSPKEAREGRKPTMGKGLDKITRGMGTKMPINVVEGKRRPEQPVQAAKLASECGVAVRQQVPIFTHWKEYKKDVNKNVFEEFMGTLAGRFSLNTNDKATTDVCTDMLKGGQRQMRYRLKKRYFDGVPANQVSIKSPARCITDQQWEDLVEKWSNPKNKEISEKNKQNRGNVKFQQRTGSRSYIAHCYSLKEKYKDDEPNAIDLFKECHNSKNNGFSEPVKQAIADMEAMMDQPVEESQEPKTSTKIVSDVLGTSKFIHNVGFTSSTKNTSTPAAAAHTQQLQQALQFATVENATLQEKIQSQQQEIDTLKKNAEEADAVRNKHAEEMEQVKKKQDETDAILRRLLSISQVQTTS